MSQRVEEQSNIHGISEKGQSVFEALSQELKEQHFGHFIAIEVDSGEYFIGETAVEATRKAKARHPDKIFFLGRIGYRTAYTFKGRR